MTTKELFNQYWHGLKEGKNILISATVLIAISLVLLRIFKIVDDSTVNVGILIVLSVFLVSSYVLSVTTEALERKVDNLSDDLERHKVNLDDFIGDWHKYNLTNTFKKAKKSIKIVNRIGHNSLANNYQVLLEALNRDCEIMIIIGNEEVAKQQSLWTWTNKEEIEYLKEHARTIELLGLLKKEKITGEIKVRMIPVPYSYSLIIVDSQDADSHFMVAPYSFPTRTDYGWQITSNELTSKNLASFIEKDFELAWGKSKKID